MKKCSIRWTKTHQAYFAGVIIKGKFINVSTTNLRYILYDNLYIGGLSLFVVGIFFQVISAERVIYLSNLASGLTIVGALSMLIKLHTQKPLLADMLIKGYQRALFSAFFFIVVYAYLGLVGILTVFDYDTGDMAKAPVWLHLAGIVAGIAFIYNSMQFIYLTAQFISRGRKTGSSKKIFTRIMKFIALIGTTIITAITALKTIIDMLCS